MTSDHLNALPPGFRFEEYEIIRVLGSGGFGLTYLGFDHNLDKPVAIKEYLPNDLAVRQESSTVLPKSPDDKDDFEWGLDRFLDEARVLAKFDHPNIIKVFRFFREHETGYIVMEYAEGETLADRLKKERRLSQDEVWRILEPILRGLRVVHDNEFLHRDIKPGNIIIREDGSPVLIDFGSARQALGVRSRSITAIVSPGYAPLEQYSVRGNQGPWTDIYALGAVAYKCLTGRVPPDATVRIKDDPYISIQKAMGEEKPSNLLKAVDAALSPDPDNRPHDISEWLDMLAGKAPPPKRKDKKTISPTKPHGIGARLGAFAKPLAALFVIGAIGIAAYLYWPAGEEPAEPGPTPESVEEARKEAEEAARIATVKQAQELLNRLGYEVGPPNGLMTTRTIAAVRQFEGDEELVETGEVDSLLLNKLEEALARKDDAAWQAALEAGTLEAVEDYRNNWADGRHVDEIGAALDRISFETAKAANSVQALEKYRQDYPEGAFITEAGEEIEKIRAAEDAAFAEAKLAGTIDAYEAFIDDFPSSRHVAEANAAIADIISRDEEAAWARAKRLDRIPAYEAYKENYPRGKYLAEANTAIARLIEETEEAAWADAKRADTIEAYEAYLEAYPRGKYIVEANEAMATVAVRREEEAWAEAKEADTAEAYEAYLEAYPRGKYRDEAGRAMEAVTARLEEEAWQAALRADTRQAYRAYLGAYPDGKYVSQANAALAAVAEREEDVAWAEAQKADTVEAYEQYKAKYPQGKYLAQADAAIKLLSQAASSAERADWRELQKTPTVAAYREFLRKYPRGANAQKARKFFEPYPVSWEKTLGGGKDDEGAAVALLADGVLAVAGTTESKGSGGADVWILKLNGAGDIVWEMTYGGGGDERATGIVGLPRNELAYSGWRKASGSRNANMLVGRLGSAGNVIWERTYGGNGDEIAAGLAILPDDRLAIAGAPREIGSGRNKMRLVKLGATGNITWELTFDTNLADRFGGLASLADGGLAVATSTSYQRDHHDFWILRLDRGGQQEWGNAFGSRKNEFADAIRVLNDGFLVAGRIEDGGGANEIQIMKLDRAGNLVWERIFSGSGLSAVRALALAPDGTILAAGAAETGDEDAWLAKLDATGTQVWETTFGGRKNQRLNGLVVLADGGLVGVGTNNSGGAGGRDLWLVRLDPQ